MYPYWEFWLVQHIMVLWHRKHLGLLVWRTRILYLKTAELFFMVKVKWSLPRTSLGVWL